MTDKFVEDDIEVQAAKQLLAELKMMRNQVYMNKGVMNPVLIINIKRVVRGTMKKYHNNDLLVGENVEVKLSNYGKYPDINFHFTPKLDLMMKNIIEEIKKKEQAAKDESNKAHTEEV